MVRSMIVLCLLLALGSAAGFAQPLEFEWVTVGGDSSENILYKGIETMGNEYLLVGSTKPLGQNGILDVLIVKFSTNGDFVEQRGYDFGYRDAGLDIESATDSTFVVAGYATHTPNGSFQYPRMLAMWIDEAGDTLQTRYYGSSSSAVAICRTSCPYPSFWLFGQDGYYGTNTGFASRLMVTSTGDSVYAFSEGWQNNFSSGFTDAESLPGGGAVAAYGSSGFIINPQGNPEYFGYPRVDRYGCFLDPEWSTAGGGWSLWRRHRIALRADGAVLRLAQFSLTQSLVRHYAPSGEFLGQDSLYLYGVDIAVGPDSGWVIATTVTNEETGTDIYVVGYNAGSQQVLWQSLPLEGEQGVLSIERLSDGSYLVIGTSRLVSGDMTYVVAKTNPVTALGFSPRPEIPATPTLYQNYPNPFNASTTIRYGLSRASEVHLVIYDVLGREVVVLVNGWQQVGSHTVQLDGRDLPSGLYLCRLRAGGSEQVQKVLLLK